ncbi:RNA polymerase sigma factor RpoE [Labilithrix luteola]|uniref:RNA polymerase sigma factor RpoE n=1 Tax=Labilithrix luteola TaxID=1391654 RepID=A0A0K1PNU6_9BACT|nr:sigma-70 family RNA polymerase sigma factor [Labilithrix luteola]AKU95081.1 RNA polymerase sigma factor RpoE [Labilithrix luteola]
MVAMPATLQDTHEAVFCSMFRAHYGYVCHTLLRLGVRESDVEDQAHELFLAVHRQLDSYDDTRPLRPWLFGFAVRAASAYRRLARHHHEVRTDREVASRGPALDAESEAHARRLVLEALGAISDLGKQSVFVLHELDGFSIPEVAAALGIPLNTAYSRLRVARQEFRRAVLQLENEEET